MSQPQAIVRVRVTIADLPSVDTQKFYDDEAIAIAESKHKWPTLCEMALTEGSMQEITVIDRQGQVYWERRAPIQVVRDHSMTDDQWVRHVLQQYGPLSTPQIEAVARLKRSRVHACLRALAARNVIQKCGVLKNSRGGGRRADAWDVADL